MTMPLTIQRRVFLPALPLIVLVLFILAPASEAQAQVYDPTTILIPQYQVDPLENDYVQPSGTSYSYESFALYEAVFLTELFLWKKLMMSTALGYRSFNPKDDFLEGTSGLMDIPLTLKWYVLMNHRLNLALAGYGTLPAGSEDVDAGLFNVGFFALAHWMALEQLRLTGKLGANFYEPEFVDQNREGRLRAVLSISYLLTDALMLYSTIDLQQNREFGSPINTPSSFNGGANYRLTDKFSLGGRVGTGLGEDEAGFIIALYLTTRLGLFR